MAQHRAVYQVMRLEKGFKIFIFWLRGRAGREMFESKLWWMDRVEWSPCAIWPLFFRFSSDFLWLFMTLHTQSTTTLIHGFIFQMILFNESACEVVEVMQLSAIIGSVLMRTSFFQKFSAVILFDYFDFFGENTWCQTWWAEYLYTDCFPMNTTISNGTILRNETQDGGVLYQFQCNPYFYLNGSSVVSCLRGQWNGSAPSCMQGKETFFVFRKIFFN